VSVAPRPTAADALTLARRRFLAAERLDMTHASYWDLENFDDEAFCLLSLAELRTLGEMFGVEPRVVLLGPAAMSVEPSVTFTEIRSRLAARVSRDGCSTEEWGQRVGWEIGGVLADPAALWSFNVEGLYDICQALELDWVAALPTCRAAARTDAP